MAQNIYDDPEFFEGYKNLRKTNQGFNLEFEQPAIRGLLSDLKNKAVLDIGCGFGDFCRFAKSQGANPVVGIDVSTLMLKEAQENHESLGIEYQAISLEKAEFKTNLFDYIVSSVTLHYVENYPMVVKKIYQWLKRKGIFVFSVEHPICTANPDCVNLKDHQNREIFPVFNYRDEIEFKQSWFVDGVIKYHRTVSSYLNGLLEVGFQIQKVLEPMPSDQLIRDKPRFAIHKIRPPLLVVKAMKI